ncbi:SusC/RagA family TonB-linked outer membrane protein [Limibacter armeniacum]|uniref:SusC/RagA family TonB-linked outer membrane protein n=1 Tax=Limibacter armeniacum TaxID=466084 RepID=UPI002FE5801D
MKHITHKLKTITGFIVLLTFLGITELSAQEIKLSGSIKDQSTGEPLIGAAVMIKGENAGTITNLDGQYELMIKSDKGILVVSYIGYIKKEVSINGRSVIDLALEPDMQQLDEIIVVGYGTTKKEDLTTSVSSVKTDDIPAAANASASSLLMGRAAGLQTTLASSEPGGQINLSIRGGGAPLIVVDGVIMPLDGLEPANGNYGFNGVNRGGLGGINPNDIESIEVLKDASASIYGVNAANGVILITTKSGKAGKLKVSYSGSRSVVENANYLNPLSAKEYKQYYNQLSYDQYLIQNGMGPFGAGTAGNFEMPYSESDIAATGAGTDWLGEVLQTGHIDNHSLNVNGGSENAVYYFSGNYFNQEGTVKNSGMTRYNGKMNMLFNLTERLRLNTSLNASRNLYSNSMTGVQQSGAGSQDYGAVQAALAYPATVSVRDEAGNYSKFGVIGNPVSLLDITDETKATSLLSNISLEYDIIKDKLTGKVLYGNNYEISEREFFIPSTTFYAQLNTARGALSQQKRENHTIEGILTYDDQLTEDISLNVVAGAGQYFTYSSGFGLQYADTHDAIGNSNAGAASGQKLISSNKWEEQRRSFFVRSNLSFYDRYLVSLSYRYDGVDKFFPDKKYAGFPSASLAWKVSNESFLRDVEFINLLKVRASYGVLGNKDALGTAAYGAYAPDVSSVAFNGTNTVFPYVLEGINWPNLTWEKTKVKNFGIDFELAKGKVSGSVDIYQKDITDLLRTIPAPPLSFMSEVPVNGGHQVNRGFEVMLNTVNVRNENFEWNTQVNLSSYNIKWKSFAEGEVLASYVQENDYVNAIYYYETDGLIQVGDDVPAHQPERASQPGSPLFVDQNGDGVIDVNDVQVVSPYPDMYIGLGNTFRYKSFDLSVFAYGKAGNMRRNYSYSWINPISFLGNVQNSTDLMGEVWTTSNQGGTLPGVAYDEASMGLPVETDVNLVDASFIRVRNITLGYNFKPDAIKGVNSLRVYADVQNPFLFSSYRGIDPETNDGGAGIKGSPGSYPMVRTYSIGLNANF